VPPESDDNLHLEIGHVLFIDIVGYSKLLIEEQKERLNQLAKSFFEMMRCFARKRLPDRKPDHNSRALE